MKILSMTYEEYIDYQYKYYSNMIFPYPKYDDKELIKSFDKLRRIDFDSNSYKNLSINYRIGDRLILHFHESIYNSNYINRISPFNAWRDKNILKQLIENNVLYHNHLNKNKLLQGMNTFDICKRVNVFSASRSKLIINKYLSDCNTIFDPFSGFSGRMLGVLSLDKTYIGYDLSLTHVNESNKMITFLKNVGYKINAIINQMDLFHSYGEYECLFTSLSFINEEQYPDVPIMKLSQDELIDECLKRFKCRKYLFVVDNTTKYKDYIVETIVNKSYNSKPEYIIFFNTVAGKDE